MEKVSLVNNGYVVAVASILIDKAFVVRDIKVVQKKTGGYLVAMPSRKNTSGEYYDIAHPVNKETRELIEDKIMNAFYKQIDDKLSTLAEGLGSDYHFSFKTDNVCVVALLKGNELVDEYTLDSYTQEQLDELYEEIKEGIGA